MEKMRNMNALISNKMDWSKSNVKVANQGLTIQTNYLTDEQNNLLRLIFAKMSTMSFDWQVNVVPLSKDEIFKTLKLSKDDIRKDWWNYEKHITRYFKDVLMKLAIYNETDEALEVISLFDKIKVLKGINMANKKDDVAFLTLGKSAQDFFYQLGKEKPFFTYNLGQYISLKGSASKALFEQLRRYYYIGEKTSKRFSEKFYQVDELKKILDMESYETRNFTRQLKEVIVPRLKKTVSFESLTMEVQKSYGKTFGYSFKWSYKEEENKLKNMANLNKLINDGIFTESQIKDYKSGYSQGSRDAELIEEYKQYVDEQAEKQIEARKMKGYEQGVKAKARKKIKRAEAK